MSAPSANDQPLDSLGQLAAATFTVVRGADEADVIRLFGGHPENARQVTLSTFPTSPTDYGVERIAVSRSGTTVVVVESNGYQGSREEVLRPLSQLGRVASAFWNVNAHSRLSLAEEVLILSSFDMLFPDDVHGTRPDAWRPLLQGISFGTSDWGAGLAALQRATGARLDAAWAAGPHLAVDIVPVRRVLVPQDLAGSPLLQQEPFASYVTDLGPHLLPQMQRYALELAISHAGVSDHPLVVAALAAKGTPAVAREHLRDELTTAYHEGVGEGHQLRITDPDDNRPEWELPSHLAARRAIVLHALAEYLDPDLSHDMGHHDPGYTLTAAMTGEGDLIERFWLLHRLYKACQQMGTEASGGSAMG
ncbi:DUF6461 domain-containing protein [Streptomyces sp. NPDC058274]|uniref:DUF6461 domain-containing protein n=1 Tax=Streptomyces sp. NPDC058274 TaxID=3346416 RepID=UPI0036EF15AE